MVSPYHYVKLLPNLPSTATLAQFLHCYLRDKAKNEIAAIEIAYNIVHAIKKNAHLSECSLFQSILEETLPQDIWYDKMITIEKLRVRIYILCVIIYILLYDCIDSIIYLFIYILIYLYI